MTSKEETVLYMTEKQINKYIRKNSTQKYCSLYAQACAKDILEEFFWDVIFDVLMDLSFDNTRVNLIINSSKVKFNLPDYPNFYWNGSFYEIDTHNVREENDYLIEMISKEITRIFNVEPNCTNPKEWCLIVKFGERWGWI